jgi:hypothetical protein
MSDAYLEDVERANMMPAGTFGSDGFCVFIVSSTLITNCFNFKRHSQFPFSSFQGQTPKWIKIYWYSFWVLWKYKKEVGCRFPWGANKRCIKYGCPWVRSLWRKHQFSYFISTVI